MYLQNAKKSVNTPTRSFPQRPPKKWILTCINLAALPIAGFVFFFSLSRSFRKEWNNQMQMRDAGFTWTLAEELKTKTKSRTEYIQELDAVSNIMKYVSWGFLVFGVVMAILWWPLLE